MCVRFNGKRWGSQQPKQVLAQRGSTHYTHYLSNCLREKRDTGTVRVGGTHFSFHKESNNVYVNNGRILLTVKRFMRKTKLICRAKIR